MIAGAPAKDGSHNPEENRLLLALEDLEAERAFHDPTRGALAWGEQNHDPIAWLSILTEEVGSQWVPELRSTHGSARAANEYHWGRTKDARDHALAQLRTELIETAAVAIAAVQSLDRDTRRDHDGP